MEIHRKVREMENLECPHCGNTLASGVAVCGSCGKEVKDDEIARPHQDQPF
jgi:DNA-directed RNA polymerase subunit RPC12/RpoP